MRGSIELPSLNGHLDGGKLIVKPALEGRFCVLKGGKGLLYMLVGECKKCGERYYGWALSMEDQQTCSECGSKLTICDEAMNHDFESTGPSPVANVS